MTCDALILEILYKCFTLALLPIESALRVIVNNGGLRFSPLAALLLGILKI